MSKPAALLLLLAALSFCGSAFLGYHSDPPVFSGPDMPLALAGGQPGARMLPAMMAPVPGALSLLLLVVSIAVVLHALHVLAEARSGRAGGLDEQGPMIVALCCGAALPLLWPISATGAFIAALAMMLGAMTAMVRGHREGSRVSRLASVGLFAGWALIAGFGAFSLLLTGRLGVMPELAEIVSLVLAVGAAMAVQSRIGSATSFSVAVIWALLGLAAAGIESGTVLAPAAIVGIAAMTLVLARAAT